MKVKIRPVSTVKSARLLEGEEFVSARKFAYLLLHSTEIETKLERRVRLSIEILILLSIFMVVIETVHSLNVHFHAVFYVVDLGTGIIFLIEYILRVWSIVEHSETSLQKPIISRLRYVFSFWAIVDLIAISPVFIHLFAFSDLRLVRALRLLRLERLLKIGRYSEPFNRLRNVIRMKRKDLTVFFMVVCIILLVTSSLMYFVEHEAQPDKFSDIPSSLWWGVVTLTSVGYGDIYPVTVLGKLFGGVIAVLCIAVVSIPSGIIISGYMNDMAKQEQKGKYCPHCGRELHVDSWEGIRDLGEGG